MKERNSRVERLGGEGIRKIDGMSFIEPVVFVKKEPNEDGSRALLGVAKKSVIKDGNFYLENSAPEIAEVFAGVVFSRVSDIEDKLERVLAMPWPDADGLAKIRKAIDGIRVSILGREYRFDFSETQLVGISMCFGVFSSDGRYKDSSTGVGIGIHPEVVVSEIQFADIVGAFEDRLARRLGKALMCRIAKDFDLTINDLITR